MAYFPGYLSFSRTLWAFNRQQSVQGPHQRIFLENVILIQNLNAS